MSWRTCRQLRRLAMPYRIIKQQGPSMKAVANSMHMVKLSREAYLESALAYSFPVACIEISCCSVRCPQSRNNASLSADSSSTYISPSGSCQSCPGKTFRLSLRSLHQVSLYTGRSVTDAGTALQHLAICAEIAPSTMKCVAPVKANQHIHLLSVAVTFCSLPAAVKSWGRFGESAAR